MLGKAIHISDIMAFKQCRQRWQYSSSLRRNLTPRIIYTPFFTGRLMHAIFEQLYGYGVVYSEAISDFDVTYRQEVGEQAYQRDLDAIEQEYTLAAGIMQHYHEWLRYYKGPFADADIEWVMLEKRFETPLYTPGKQPQRTNRRYISRRAHLAGRFDGIVRYRVDGKLYLWENKTTRSIVERKRMLAIEEQADAYMLAASTIMNEPVAGVIYNLVRKDVPSEPAVLQNGLLSQDKRINTTAQRYLKSIKKHHAPDLALFTDRTMHNQWIHDHYGAMLDHLLHEDKLFFDRVAITRTPEQLKRTNDDILAVALEMTHPRIPIYRTGDTTYCNRCVFREPCLLTYNNRDIEAETMLTDYFQPNTYHALRESDVTE